METVKVKFKKLHENAVLPTYAKDGDMGMDLTAVDRVWDKDIDCFVYRTGLAVEVPKGYGMLIFPRSSNRKTGLYLPNSVGIIDSGYRGEILVSYKTRVPRNIDRKLGALANAHTDSFIEAFRNVPEDVIHSTGDKIAQAVIFPYPYVEPEWAEELSETERGTGGHGSTGA
jgi:dUTP pyrophosphatase